MVEQMLYTTNGHLSAQRECVYEYRQTCLTFFLLFAATLHPSFLQFGYLSEDSQDGQGSVGESYFEK